MCFLVTCCEIVGGHVSQLVGLNNQLSLDRSLRNTERKPAAIPEFIYLCFLIFSCNIECVHIVHSGFWKIAARKQIELATCGSTCGFCRASYKRCTDCFHTFIAHTRSATSLAIMDLPVSIELCVVISLSLGDWFSSQKAIPHKAHVPAQSPFHKQLTEKRKDGRLFHLSASRVSL
jgi:hypothetical protein